MMDRNTLTALLLITVVLIITPYYMELISPTTKDAQEYFEDQQNTMKTVLYIKIIMRMFPRLLPQPLLFFHRKRKKQLKLKTTCLSPALVLYMVAQLDLLRQKSTLKMTVVW